MAIAWLLGAWRTKLKNSRPARYPAINDFIAPQIGGQPEKYAVVHLANNLMLAKASLTSAEQGAIDGQGSEFARFLRNTLSGSLATLTVAQKNALRTALTNRGWTLQEIETELGTDFSGKTLRDLLRLILLKRDLVEFPGEADGWIDWLEARIQ